MPCRVALDRPVLRASLVASSLLAALAGGGCRETGSNDQDSRPLPAPEPPASAAAPPLREETPAFTKRKAVDEDDGAAKSKPAAPAAKPVEPSAETPPVTPPAAVGTEGSAGTGPAVVPSAVPPLAAPSAACLSRCQGAMQSCLSTPVDGGVPGFANLELCKKAFEACQAACAKQ